MTAIKRNASPPCRACHYRHHLACEDSRCGCCGDKNGSSGVAS